MARYAGFIGPSARARSKIACDDRTMNLFIEKNESGTAKASYSAYRTPGYATFCDLGTNSPVRGTCTLNGATWAVAGTQLSQLPFTLGGAATTLTAHLTNPDDSPVSICGNGDGGFQLAIAGAGSLYCYDLRTNTLTLIPDVSATQVVFMDGAAIALDPDSSTLYASADEDFSDWSALDVAQRNATADKMQAIARVGPELWAFGSQTTSVYFDAGNAEFPLSPNPSVLIQRGIAAPWSVAVSDGVAFWLGQGTDGGGTVYRAQGYSPQPVSTSAVEYAISQMSVTSDAEAGIYQEDGNQFYVLNFPTANQTWVYDISEGLWHERGEWNGLDYDALPVRGFVYTGTANLVGSRTDGLIYQQSLTYATETDGETPIRWLRRAPHLCTELTRVTYRRLRLDAEVGVGLSTTVAANADPRVGLRYSDDGGQSFGNVLYASLGAVGDYGALVEWWMLGNSRDRVFEVFGAAPVVTALIDAYLELRPGTS